MYKVPQKLHRLKGPKKRTNSPKNPYFKWLRDNRPECVVCGDLGEVHHLEFGCNADDTRVVMLCLHHHSAQSNDGLHKSPNEWYTRFYSFEELESMATDNHIAYLSAIS